MSEDFPPHTPVYRVNCGFQRNRIHLDPDCYHIKRANGEAVEKTLGMFPDWYDRCDDCFPDAQPTADLNVAIDGKPLVEDWTLTEGETFVADLTAGTLTIEVVEIDP